MRDEKFYPDTFKAEYERRYNEPFLFNPGPGWCRGCNGKIGGSFGGKTLVAFHHECLQVYFQRRAEMAELKGGAA